jgi:hypothetical protein
MAKLAVRRKAPIFDGRDHRVSNVDRGADLAGIGVAESELPNRNEEGRNQKSADHPAQ